MARIADGGRGSRGAARAVVAIRQQAAGDRRRGPGPSGTCPGSPPDGSPAGTVDSSGDVSRQQAAPRTRARMGSRGDVSRIAAGDRGRQQGRPRPGGAGVQGRGMGRRGSPPVKGRHVFISFGPDCFRRGSRATCPGGSRPPGPWTCPGQRAAGWIAAGSRGRPRPGGRIISARAAGRRGRVHFDGRQGRGAQGQRGRDRAHAYTREHKTRVRPLPLKKIFLFPVGEYLARKTGVFPHGSFFCAMLFTSQGKRPAGDGGKPPKKIPEKNF